jgi:hypothetical protein
MRSSRSLEVGDAAAVTGREHPDVALVGLPEESSDATTMMRSPPDVPRMLERGERRRAPLGQQRTREPL